MKVGMKFGRIYNPQHQPQKVIFLVFGAHDSNQSRYKRRRRRSMIMVTIVMDKKVLSLTPSILKENKIYMGMKF